VRSTAIEIADNRIVTTRRRREKKRKRQRRDFKIRKRAAFSRASETIVRSLIDRVDRRARRSRRILRLGVPRQHKRHAIIVKSLSPVRSTPPFLPRGGWTVEKRQKLDAYRIQRRSDGRRLYLINKVGAKECTLGREWTRARYQRYRVQRSGDERAANRAEGCQRARGWAMIIESGDDDNGESATRLCRTSSSNSDRGTRDLAVSRA